MLPPMYDLKSEWMFGVSRLGHSVGSRFSDWGVTECTSWDVVPISFSCFGGLSRFWAVWMDWQCYIQGLLFFPFGGQLHVNLAGFCPKHAQSVRGLSPDQTNLFIQGCFVPSFGWHYSSGFGDDINKHQLSLIFNYYNSFDKGNSFSTFF